MIKEIAFIVCDLCEVRLEFPTDQRYGDLYEDGRYWAQQHGWHAERGEHHQYCPACKVPVKLAKSLEATPFMKGID